MQPNTRAVIGLLFSADADTEVRLPRGFLENRVFLSGTGQDVITVAATSVRARGVPIKQVQLLDGSKPLHTMRPQDLINEAEVFEQQALSSMVSTIPGVGIATHVFSYDIPLLFEESHATDPLVTALATWMYEELILRVSWGNHAQLAVGGTGTVTQSFTGVTLAGNQFSVEEEPADLYSWASMLGRSLRSFKETATAAANAALTIELPRTASIRQVTFKTEDANAEPVNTILNSVTIEINNKDRQISAVTGRVIRSNMSKIYGVTPPPGMYTIDFAEDRNIDEIMPAKTFGALNAILDVAAVTGTVRTITKRIESAAV